MLDMAIDRISKGLNPTVFKEHETAESEDKEGKMLDKVKKAAQI